MEPEKEITGRGVGRPNGGNLNEKIKYLRRSPIKVEKDFKFPNVKIHEVDTKRRYYCTCCGKSYTTQQGNFPSAGSSILWQANGGYAPICKSCLDTIYNALIRFFSGNEEHALERVCQIFDMFYDEAASAMAEANVRADRTKVSSYPSRINTRQVKIRGSTYLDNIRAEADSAAVIKNYGDIQQTTDETSHTDFVVTKEMASYWGFGFAPEDYEYLCNEEGAWRTRVECKTKPQEELIKALCMAQLQMRKAQTGGKATDIAAANKSYTDLLGACNLQPRQNAIDEGSDQSTFGTLIKKWEMEQPLPTPDPEWEDVDGIKDYIDTFFFGHLCNVAHIPNEHEASYRKAMERYTVTPPTYDGDEDGIDDTSILDKLSGRSDR